MKIKKDVKISEYPIAFTMSKIGGKWKPIILFLIDKGVNRFGMMRKEIEGISKQMLTIQLRELEDDKLINRKIFSEIPPRVEYSITERGKSLFTVINNMRIWGENNM